MSAEEIDRTARLLEAWYAGDRAALNDLLGEHLEWLRAVASRELGGGKRERFDSLDLVQDGVLRLLRAGPKYAPQNRAQFRALLVKALRSALYDQLDRQRAARRDAGREERLPSGHLSRVQALGGATPPGPGTVLHDRHLRARVRAALARLEPEERDLIRLRQTEGVAFEEIAARLAIASPDAARMRFNRAVKRLSELLLATRAGAADDAASEASDGGGG